MKLYFPDYVRCNQNQQAVSVEFVRKILPITGKYGYFNEAYNPSSSQKKIKLTYPNIINSGTFWGD